jgi:class 3 adenylate cyclase
MRSESSIDAVAAALAEESLDLGGMSSPDGAVTLLFTDSDEGSNHLDELVRRLVDQHDGQVVKSEGHASMCSFASSHAGLRCAIALQRKLAGQLRAGLHSGFVMADESEFYGRNVMLAARIAEQARPGEILVSRAVTEYTGTDPSFHFEARGEQHFKGLLGEHEVFSVAWS